MVLGQGGCSLGVSRFLVVVTWQGFMFGVVRLCFVHVCAWGSAVGLVVTTFCRGGPYGVHTLLRGATLTRSRHQNLGAQIRF